MDYSMEFWISAVLIGIGATAVMDLWGLALQQLRGIPPPNYALVGRWIAYMGQGRFRHAAISAAAAMPAERLIGWTAHYLIGIAFATLLLAIWGLDWVRAPTLLPALVVGIGTVTSPFLLMQPAMGAGIASRRTPRPGAARLRSLTTHAIFGLGLYVAGWATHLLLID